MLRTQVRTGLTAGRYPQIVLRLGRPACTWSTPRRAPREVLLNGPVEARR
ncbi:hypothetical protein [Streptomyces sp. NBC_00878]|nr:hypothetical protein [Streptomyces sp. NBC_00878]MCX4904030.1 hypothetical protein [Streptomyces sp. NBC_00878]